MPVKHNLSKLFMQVLFEMYGWPLLFNRNCLCRHSNSLSLQSNESLFLAPGWPYTLLRSVERQEQACKSDEQVSPAWKTYLPQLCKEWSSEFRFCHFPDCLDSSSTGLIGYEFRRTPQPKWALTCRECMGCRQCYFSAKCWLSGSGHLHLPTTELANEPVC